MQTQRVLVVGTTSDYIDILRHKYPSKSLLFITSTAIRDKATEERPEPDEEILYDLDEVSDNSPKNLTNLIHQHLEHYNIFLKGITCFDCESMALAAHIASAFALSYPSIESIMACRDKSLTKKLWHENQVPCPEYAKVSSAAEAVDFFENQSRVASSVCVLKPVDSSGSERVFRCSSAKECEDAYNIICKPQQSPDIIIETCVEGTEYSCDFIIINGNLPLEQLKQKSDIIENHYINRVIPIRFTRKIPAPIPIFGTIMAYEMVDFLSENDNLFKSAFHTKNVSSFLEDFSISTFLSVLERAAKSLGITTAICMVDFIIKDGDILQKYDRKSETVQNFDPSWNRVSLLEMAPRPGGDCLPWLIQSSMNIDILKLTLDFACKQESIFNSDTYNNNKTTSNLVGLRIHANKAGILKSIDISVVKSDSRVKEVFIKHRPGHKITLPPQNYDSWNMGHIIFKPFEETPCKDQCLELLSLLKIEIV